MARSLTANTLAQLTQQRVFPVVFCELDFADGNSFIWSGVGNMTWNSHTWIGVGQLGKISAIEEGNDVQARGITLTLTGVPQNLLNEALTQCRQGNAVKLWFGFLDASGNVIADPYQSFSGRMDMPTVDEGGETATISITAESRLIDLNRSRERRYTHDDQQIDFPGDRGFEYVPSLQQVNVVWGRGSTVPQR